MKNGWKAVLKPSALVRRRATPRAQFLFLILGPLFALLLLFVSLSGCSGQNTPYSSRSADSLEYVGSIVCAECHQSEMQAWTGSDHDLAMEKATPETVLGDFQNAVFSHLGVETRFFQRGDSFFVRTEGPSGKPETFHVQYTFGVRPLQQYLVPFSDGRVQTLTVAWDTEKNRWFSLYPGERIRPDDWLHWTKGGMNWNYMCAECHSTNLKKNFDLETNTYHTTFSEIDVSCESCHGPGSRHVAWGRQPDAERNGTASTGLIVDLKGPENARTQIETCAPCHSRRRIVSTDFLPGSKYLDYYAPELLDSNLYFADGQIKDEVYVYASFLQSKMYHNGVRCSDCHDPHSTRIVLQGNALCNQCHSPEQYDAPTHLHHIPGTSGAQCVDCHMPERTYMVVDPRRDHSFKVPRPDLTARIGIPNACNGCHTSQSPEWARDTIVSWFGSSRRDTTNFALAFAAGRDRRAEAEPELTGIVQKRDRPGIVRATALSLLGSYGSPTAGHTSQAALADPDPLVRAAAVRNLEYLPPDDLYQQITPIVADSVRLVRTEAARVLSRIASSRFSENRSTGEAAAFWKALQEYRASQKAVEDQPGAHLNLAVIHENLSEPYEAEAAYRTAIRLDSSFVPARMNLALLLDRLRMNSEQQGQVQQAASLRMASEEQLKAALRFQPDMPELHYTLGLLLAEDEASLSEAAKHLSRAASLSPQNARIHYNAGLAYQQLGQNGRAEELLLAANRIQADQPDFLNALSVFYFQQQRWKDALSYTLALNNLYPNTPALDQRIAYIRRQLGQE